jgi:hypothetical protein
MTPKLTAEDVERLFDATSDVIAAMQLSLTEVLAVAESLQSRRNGDGSELPDP